MWSAFLYPFGYVSEVLSVVENKRTDSVGLWHRDQMAHSMQR